MVKLTEVEDAIDDAGFDRMKAKKHLEKVLKEYEQTFSQFSEYKRCVSFSETILELSRILLNSSSMFIIGACTHVKYPSIMISVIGPNAN